MWSQKPKGRNRTGKSLVCGKCKTSLEPGAEIGEPAVVLAEANSSGQLPKSDGFQRDLVNANSNQETVYYDQDGVFISNRIIRARDGQTIRTSDVQSVKIEIKDNPASTAYMWAAWILGFIGIVIYAWRFWPNDTGPGVLIYEAPAIFCAINYFRLGYIVGKVVVRTASGVFELIRYTHVNHATYTQTGAELKSIAESVGSAIKTSHSK